MIIIPTYDEEPFLGYDPECPGNNKSNGDSAATGHTRTCPVCGLDVQALDIYRDRDGVEMINSLRTGTVELRVTSEEKAVMRNAAERAGLALSTWSRMLLLREAGKSIG